MTKLKFVLPVLAGLVLAAAPVFLIAEDKPSPTTETKTLRAVIHVNFADADQQGHGLTNVKNMLKAVNGKAEIEVVCHGAGIALVVQDQSKHPEGVAALIKQGVRFVACENTLREKSISKEILLPNVGTVPSGAVEVIRKQQEGYGYFKP